MTFPETKTAKTVATITLLSFFWVYLGLNEIAIAGNDTAESGVHSSREKAKNGEWHTAKRRGEDISEEEREIEKQEAGIDQLEDLSSGIAQ